MCCDCILPSTVVQKGRQYSNFLIIKKTLFKVKMIHQPSRCSESRPMHKRQSRDKTESAVFIQNVKEELPALPVLVRALSSRRRRGVFTLWSLMLLSQDIDMVPLCASFLFCCHSITLPELTNLLNGRKEQNTILLIAELVKVHHFSPRQKYSHFLTKRLKTEALIQILYTSKQCKK